MAIAPNTTFTSGAILTAAQMNALPFGIVAIGTRTANQTFAGAEAISVTSSAFTAIANRYYKITFYEPSVAYTSGTVNYVEQLLYKTNLAGTQLQYGPFTIGAFRGRGIVEVTTTFAAGSTVVVGSLSPSGGGTVTASASATLPAQIIVQDIGPA